MVSTHLKVFILISCSAACGWYLKVSLHVLCTYGCARRERNQIENTLYFPFFRGISYRQNCAFFVGCCCEVNPSIGGQALNSLKTKAWCVVYRHLKVFNFFLVQRSERIRFFKVPPRPVGTHGVRGADGKVSKWEHFGFSIFFRGVCYRKIAHFLLGLVFWGSSSKGACAKFSKN